MIEWNKLINGLQDKGFSLRQLGKKCGCSHASIIDYRDRDIKPTYEVGHKLVMLGRRHKVEMR